MKKKPKNHSYTKILKAIAKVKTIKQLDKVQIMVVDYAGAPYKVTNLYKKYNAKNYRIRNNPKTR